LGFEPVDDWQIPLVRGVAQGFVAHLEDHGNLVARCAVGEPGVEESNHRRLVGVRADLIWWCSSQRVDVISGYNDRVADIAVLDEMPVRLKRVEEAGDFASDLECFLVIDKALELSANVGWNSILMSSV
jgi:hypothetical protein